MYTETAGEILAKYTVAVMERFGWTTFSALVTNPVSHIVVTTAGADTTVDTTRTSTSRATRLPLLQTVCSLEHHEII